MNEEDQKSLTKIEDRLKEAFTDGPFAAYAKLNCYRWSGESIDVYASEIRRLAGLCGFVTCRGWIGDDDQVEVGIC